jgi:hypothetical protein
MPLTTDRYPTVKPAGLSFVIPAISLELATPLAADNYSYPNMLDQASVFLLKMPY